MGYRTTDLKGVESSGTGAAGRVTVWTGAETIGAEASFSYSAGFDQLQLLGSPGSILLQEGATQPNNGAGYGAIWVKNDVPAAIMYTDDAGADNYILRTDTGATINGNIMLATNTEGLVDSDPDLSWIAGVNNTLALNNGAWIRINETGTSPTNIANYGFVWVRNDAPNTLIFTDDAGTDYRLLKEDPAAPNANIYSVPYATGADGQLGFTSVFTRSAVTGDLANTGSLNLTVAGAGVKLQEGASADIAPGTGAGVVWVRDDAPTNLIFTDDTGADQSLQPMYGLGQWSFGNSTLGVTSSGTFDTDNATLALITAIRFSSTPQAGTGQAITSWGDKLPQTGILYFRDVSDPGGTSVTFPYTSLTFPLGTIAPQFNGVALSTDGTVLGTNWSANNYVVTLVPSSTTLDGAGVPGVATGNGYPLGTVYADTTADVGYILVDNSAGANVWSTQGDVAGPGSSTDNAVAKFDSTTGKIIQNSNVLVSDAGALVLSGTTDPMISMEQRAAAPTSTAGQGRWFVRTDGTNTAPPTQTPWFTNDNSYDIRLGMQSVSISGALSPASGSTWYSWSSAGPYNDTLWNDDVGTGTAPTTSSWFSRPPLILLPGDANIERVVGWYQGQSDAGNAGTWEMELVAVSIEDADTAVGTVDPIVDGSINSGFIVTDAKITLLSHTINDRTALPTDTNHMNGLYMAFQEVTATPRLVDLYFTVTIYWSTYTLDGWVSDGFATS